MDQDLIAALKALSDSSRLRVLGLLAGKRRMAVVELAAALQLSPSTVTHHLKRLSEAGLVDSDDRAQHVDYGLRLERLSSIGASLHALAKETSDRDVPLVGPDALGWTLEERKALGAVVVDGRLEQIPVHEKKRLVILRYLARSDFEVGRSYPEREVNAILALRHPDVASLRRYLVDHGFMDRGAGVYHLRPPSDWPEHASSTGD